MMSFGVILQIFANVVFTAALFVVFARLRRPAKDDPRLSKGLQLLSSKIAVLEDLSDRTETQVQQMLVLLDQKSRELQAKIGLAEQQVALIRQSMQQSLEVAQIFQDKIPHSEIIERQNSVKYIKAARMAHAGVSVADIALEVDLPIGEIEFISKVNQENLSFREEDLPAWARESEAASAPTEAAVPEVAVAQPNDGLVERLNKLQFEMKNLDLELAQRSARNIQPDTTLAFTQPEIESTSLERIGQEFRRAVEAAEAANGDEPTATSPAIEFSVLTAPPAAAMEPASSPVVAAPVAAASISSPSAKELAQAPPVNPALEAARAAAAALSAKPAAAPTTPAKSVRRVEFPRI